MKQEVSIKVRKGFVSNSSTSSFICDECKEEFAGRDLCLGDIGHFQCKNGHVFCNPLRNVEDNEDDYRYEMLPEQCPICQFRLLRYQDVGRLYLADRNVSKEKFVQEMKERFGTYEKFAQWAGIKI